MAELPLLRRFPALAALPRAPLGAFPTPVERAEVPGGRVLWIKRDDRTGARFGGNKVRALEWLLGGVKRGDELLTVGPRGSSHALATALSAQELGASTTVVRWDQEMNPAARGVSDRIATVARLVDVSSVAAAYVAAWWIRLRSRVRWIPAGGTTPIGILGYVNGALELAAQVEAGECPAPAEIVVPLGTGGTVAGLALGLNLSGLSTRVRAVRVAPKIIASRRRVMRLIARTTALIEGAAGVRLGPVRAEHVIVDDDFYGGGYGRPLVNPPESPLPLDDTYARKAFAAAVRRSSDTTLFWLTFDGRILQD